MLKSFAKTLTKTSTMAQERLQLTYVPLPHFPLNDVQVGDDSSSGVQWNHVAKILERQILDLGQLKTVLMEIKGNVDKFYGTPAHTSNVDLKFFEDFAPKKPNFFEEFLPKMQKFALRFPELFPHKNCLPFLLPQVDSSVTLSQVQFILFFFPLNIRVFCRNFFG